MINKVKSPILPTRGANRSAFYSITVDRRQLGQDRGVMVSEAAARDVSPTGITSNGYGFNIDSVGRDRIYYWKDHEIVSRKFPAVNFFTIKGAMHRLLISRSELNDMGKVFRVPADYLDNATFVFEPGNAFKAIIRFFSLSAAAGWLMVPYILWVSFAAVLNWFLMILNR